MQDVIQAEIAIGKLSKTSKLPGYSWSIPAKDCITGGKLQKIKGSVCSMCYALSGFYQFPVVKAALERRMAAWKTNENFVSDFITVLKQKTKRVKYFRWFDSGDLQSLAMIDQINTIAAALPDVKFWLPTRELKMVREWHKNGGRAEPNLFIKISAPMVGEKFSNALPNDLGFSTVGRNDDESLWQCPARHQDNKCGDCRACWSLTAVNYPAH